jgi:multiple sugar transport system permease protein
MLILMAALKTIPDEILEAAKIDGGNAIKRFFYIVFPGIRHFIALIFTLRFMDAIRMFDIVYNLTNGGPGTSTETLASTIYKTAFRYSDVGKASAGAYIFFLLILLFSFGLMKVLNRKENEI